MDYNSIHEREVDLKDLMFVILRKWKPIVLVAVIFALLLGGYNGFSEYKNGTSVDTVEATNKKYNEDLLAYEKKKENLPWQP